MSAVDRTPDTKRTTLAYVVITPLLLLLCLAVVFAPLFGLLYLGQAMAGGELPWFGQWVCLLLCLVSLKPLSRCCLALSRRLR